MIISWERWKLNILIPLKNKPGFDVGIIMS